MCELTSIGCRVVDNILYVHQWRSYRYKRSYGVAVGKQARCALIRILTVAHKADYISSFQDTLRAQHAHGVIVRVLQPLQIRLHHALQVLVGRDNLDDVIASRRPVGRSLPCGAG